MIRLPKSFPASDYTPHGYIDNPHHSMLHRSGVVRSVPPLGFGYWRTAFEGSYGGGPRADVNYLSLLLMGVGVGEATFLAPEDFEAHGARLVSRYHTKHMLSYDWAFEGLTFRLQFALPREDSLACLVEVAGSTGSPRTVLLHATHVYGLWDCPYWGSDGVAARYVGPADATVSKVWACGHAFALGAERPSDAHKATADEAQWLDWLRRGDLASLPGGSVVGPGPLRAVQSYRLTVPARGRAEVLVVLSRGTNEARALEELREGLRTFRPRVRRQLADDDAFWSQAPMLEGDWPAEWKHGWVYDFETLRMNVRPPAGIYKHPWDAMQIHSPRAVLGEASLDSMALSYADPALAQDVLLGTFADAPAPNVPCSREDGSMNMIAADGSECGTYPAWGLPFHVIQSIHARTGDDGWVRAIYPHLKAFIEWWLEHRTDADGWLHCKCSWEAQDGSKRFLIPAGGHEGSVSEHVRTVDAEAAMAEAMGIMARFAAIARRPGDAARWRHLAEDRTARVRSMFADGWFRDVDARTGRPILLPDYYDVMMLVPVACGVATAEQVSGVRPKLQYFRNRPEYWLEWPSFVFPLSEAAWNADLRVLLAEVLADIADRVYARSDRQTVRVPASCAGKPFAYRVPGQAGEYWPIDPEPAYGGGECYGWGATLPMELIRNVVGFREQTAGPPDELLLAPSLPERLLRAGGTYGIRNLHYRGLTFRVAYRVAEAGGLAVTLGFTAPRKGLLTVRPAGKGGLLARSRKAARGSVSFKGASGGAYVVRFE